MQMLLNNGTVINDVPNMSEKTRIYLNQFWKFPSKEAIEKEKDQYRIIDHKRIWQLKVIFEEIYPQSII